MPAAVLFVFYALFFGVFFGLAETLFSDPSLLLWIVGFIAGIIFGAVMTPITLRLRRRFGGSALTIALGKALKTGNLPAGAEAAGWRAMLERQRRMAKLFRWLGPLEFGVFAALGVYVALTTEKQTSFYWIDSAGFAALVIFFPIYYSRQLRRIHALLAQFPSQPTTDSPSKSP